MSKLPLYAFALLFLLTALVVPNVCQKNGRDQAEAEPAANSDFYSVMTCVVCLLALYLISKLMASQHEPNVCVYGKTTIIPT
jgi:hypothetical protein